jgi:hypothetical protein
MAALPQQEVTLFGHEVAAKASVFMMVSSVRSLWWSVYAPQGYTPARLTKARLRSVIDRVT